MHSSSLYYSIVMRQIVQKMKNYSAAISRKLLQKTQSILLAQLQQKTIANCIPRSASADCIAKELQFQLLDDIGDTKSLSCYIYL